MNPEEGEIRPQLLDRFGLCVDVQTIKDVDQRVEIVQRVESFNSSDALDKRLLQEDANLSKLIQEAKKRLPECSIPQPMLRLICEICAQVGVSGHRADIVIATTAKTLAALRGLKVVGEPEVYDAAELALRHRATFKKPFMSSGGEQKGNQGEDGDSFQEKNQSVYGETTYSKVLGVPDTVSSDTSADGQSDSNGVGLSSADAFKQVGLGDTFKVKKFELNKLAINTTRPGKRSKAISKDRRGRYIGAVEANKVNDPAFDATVRAAAPYQIGRGRKSFESPLILKSQDLRQKVRERKVGNLIVFVVDASASMDAEQRMSATKGAIFSLLEDAYIRRDRVALVVFKNRSAELVLQPTSSIELAKKQLTNLVIGGTTPLTHGLVLGMSVIKTELRKDPNLRALMVLISDGRGNISMTHEEPLVEAQKVASLIRKEPFESLVIDSARDYSYSPSIQQLARVAPLYQAYSVNACRDLAERMGAKYLGLYDLSKEHLLASVRAELSRKGT